MKRAIKESEEKNADRRGWLKIGEVASLTGTGIETLRFYERQGLLGNPQRTPSGYRMYDAEVLERLEFIKRAQVLGFTLAEIARIIAEKHAGQSPCAEVRGIVRRRLGELDARIKQMQRYRKELASALKEWEAAGDVNGHVCGLIEGTNMTEALPPERSLKQNKRPRVRSGG
jgi:DNA-binding transcriptional MerR regulator